jgi:hypothetical protein
VDDGGGGPGWADAAIAPRDGGLRDGPGCHALQRVDLGPPPEVLLLLDRSESMGTSFGTSTRYQTVAAVLADAVAGYAARIRFGYQELPGRQGCAGLAVCCASPPLLGVAERNQEAVVAALLAAPPLAGGTPLAASLAAALDYYLGAGVAGGNRFVLLATDGSPNCTGTGALAAGQTADDPACVDALAQAAALVAVGVRVIVLGVAVAPAEDTAAGTGCLDRLAQAGGAAASPGSPAYYPARDPEELARALARILGALERPSCLLDLPAGVKEFLDMAVYLDGQRIPQSASNGWQPDTQSNPKRVRITGEYCDRIQTLQVVEIEARFQCSTVPT